MLKHITPIMLMLYYKELPLFPDFSTLLCGVQWGQFFKIIPQEDTN